MANNMEGLGNLVPAVPKGLNIDFAGLINNILLIVFIGIILFFIIKFIQHKRVVKLYERVNNGYVIRNGRYRVATDKANKLEYLQPMFGGKRLPNFPTECWQKTKSLPIFGTNRIISIIKQNENSFKVMLPPTESDVGDVKYYNTLSWVYLEQFRLFEIKYKKEAFLNFIFILAPIAIIVCCTIFFGYTILLQSQLTLHAAKMIEEATQQIVKMCLN